MLTEEPYPPSKQGYTMAEVAYSKAQSESPDIKPEICSFFFFGTCAIFIPRTDWDLKACQYNGETIFLDHSSVVKYV